MSPEVVFAVIGGMIVFIVFAALVFRKLPKRIRSVHYTRKWREIQKLCKNKGDWSHAVIHADMLVDEVLVKKRITGKTMGERLVSAQHLFTINDKVWSSHKLANTLREDSDKRITEAMVKDALITFRQTLRDLGAV